MNLADLVRGTVFGKLLGYRETGGTGKIIGAEEPSVSKASQTAEIGRPPPPPGWRYTNGNMRYVGTNTTCLGADEYSTLQQMNASAAAEVRSLQPTTVHRTPYESEGQMADAQTLQTMRAAGGFTFPSALSGMLPLILVFAVIVLIIFKK